MLGPDDRMRGLVRGRGGLGLASPPRPGVAEPQRGQHVQRGILRRAVVHGDAAQDVFGRRLRVLHLDVEVASLVEDARIDQLVLQIVPRPGPVHRHEVVVGELGLRVLVEPALVAVRREVVDVEVVLLDVLTVVALGIRQAEQTLLQDRVPLVPQRERQAQPLLVVADPGEAVLTPPVRAGPRLVMAEIGPGVAAIAVVLANRAPLALAQVGPPGAPRNAGASLLQSAFLRRSRRRISRPGRIRSPPMCAIIPRGSDRIASTERLSRLPFPNGPGRDSSMSIGAAGSARTAPAVVVVLVGWTVRRTVRPVRRTAARSRSAAGDRRSAAAAPRDRPAGSYG